MASIQWRHNGGTISPNAVMTGLDLPTIIVVSSLMGALMALVLFFMRRNYPVHIRGLGYWAVAAVLWAVTGALFLITTFPGVPESLLIYTSNLLLLLSNLFYLKGTQRFDGQAAPWRPWLVFLGFMALITIWLSFGEVSYAPRLFVMIVALVLLYTSTLVTILRFQVKRLPDYLIACVLSVHIGIILLRLLHLGGIEHFFEQTLMQSLYVGSYVVAQLLYSIGAILLATDRLAMENQRQADYDHLTGIRNRRSLLQQCEDELARVARNQSSAALMIMDIDHFKQINDSRGHPFGDRVLQHFAQRVATTLTASSHFGRYGGEEFVVMLPDTDRQTALGIAQRIHQALDQGHELDCKVSIGLTTWRDDDTLETLLGRADRALYIAKAQGRNQTFAK